MPSAKPTQQFVPIKEIREGVVILKNGSMHMTLMASSINFALKSDEEQTAILAQFQNFLNALDFTVQFYISSRGLDINPYLQILRQAAESQANELLRIQTGEYIEFVRSLVETANVVSKTFYVVVSYTPSVIRTSGGGILDALTGAFRKGSRGETARTVAFEEARLQLRQRSDAVLQNLTRVGVRTVPLNTEELVELYYRLFNPGELEKEKTHLQK